MGQVIGGFGLLVIGLALLGSSLAVLADLRGSRRGAAAVAGATALLSAAGVVMVMQVGIGDAVLAAALAVLRPAMRRVGHHPGSPGALTAPSRS